MKRHSEKGAAATLVAILAAGGVLLGMMAIAVDTGALMWDRRQLQNAADASVMALAQICADDINDCDESKTLDGLGSKSLETLILSNASDDLHGLALQCDRPGTAALMTDCVALGDITDLTQCPELPEWLADSSLPYVETYTSAKSTAGPFTSLLFTDDEVQVQACARAAWGPAAVSKTTVLPITMSECNWMDATGGDVDGEGNPVYPPGPAYGDYPNGYGTDNPWPAKEIKIFAKDDPTESCHTSPAGGTAPGGFAALDTLSTTSCQGEISLQADGKLWIHGDTGADYPCSKAEFNQYYGKVVQIPIFDCITEEIGVVPAVSSKVPDPCNSGKGNNTNYRIKGFAAFYLSGWYLSSESKPSLRPPNSVPCSGADRCLSGWFLKGLSPKLEIDTSGDTPNYGITAIQPAG